MRVYFHTYIIVIPSPINSDYECVELITSTGIASNIRPTVHLVFSPFLQENIQLNRCFSLGKSHKKRDI